MEKLMKILKDLRPEVDFEKEDKLIENYSGQLNLYAMAVESMLNKKVSQKIIYSLDLGKSIVL